MNDRAAEQQEPQQRRTGDREQCQTRRRRGNREAENALEVGEPVVAAEAGVVAEEKQHRRVGQRLRDDREVNALDP